MKVRVTALKVVIILAVLLIWLNFPMYASADNICSSDSQIMFRLYSSTNAHIEKVLPIKNYNTDVCYNSIFGIDYNVSNQTQCAGSNKLLNINSITNAHAEDPALSNYNETICYGDLNCRVTTSSCSSNESFVASLSSPTNAHISAITAYPYNLCCSSNFALTNSNQTNDTIPPVISNISTIPALPLTTNISVIDFNVTFNSNEFPIIVFLSLTDSLNSVITTTSQVRINNLSDLPISIRTPANLSDGLYKLFLNASDLSNNSAIFSVGNFTINTTIILPPGNDTTPPTITLLSPANATYTALPIPILATTNENSTCTFSLDNSANQTLSTSDNLTFTGSITSISNSQHTIQVSCKDSSNNENSTSPLTFAVQTSLPDLTPPNITNLSTIPVLPLTANNSNISFNVSFSSDEFPIDVYFLLTNITNATLFTTSTFPVNTLADIPLTFAIPIVLADGVYSLFFNATDRSNNSVQVFMGYLTINSTLVPPPSGNQSNNTAPIITVHSPLPGAYNTTQLLLNVSAVNASSIWYSINSGANTTYVSPIFLVFPEGNNVLSIFANNSFNNQSNVNIVLAINTSGNGGGGGGGGGGSGGGGGGGSSSNRNRIYLNNQPDEEQPNNRIALSEYMDQNQPISLGKKKAQVSFDLTLVWLICSLLVLLILLLLILLLLAKRRNE